jgi:6-phosphofructokinase 1
MKIGILTGGGDCPGLNPVIRAVVRKAIANGDECIGIRYGWKGLLESLIVPLDFQCVSGILHRGGTILGTSRTNIYALPDGERTVMENIRRLGIDVIIAIGGEDTLGVANKLSKAGVRIVGVPKTIDNDLDATDVTFGFDTAVNIAAEAIDRLHTTAESHDRVFVVEVMGRYAGWIALYAGMASSADIMLIPEHPFTMDDILAVIEKRRSRGKFFTIVVVAEGAKLPADIAGETTKDAKKDSFGHVRLGGIGEILAREIEKRTGIESRASVLGHIQRGGTPSVYDRVLGTRFGVAAVELIEQQQFGMMVAVKGNEIVPVPLERATAQLRTVDEHLYNVAATFFG